MKTRPEAAFHHASPSETELHVAFQAQGLLGEDEAAAGERVTIVIPVALIGHVEEIEIHRPTLDFVE